VRAFGAREGTVGRGDEAGGRAAAFLPPRLFVLVAQRLRFQAVLFLVRGRG